MPRHIFLFQELFGVISISSVLAAGWPLNHSWLLLLFTRLPLVPFLSYKWQTKTWV
jgi:hypothetical protein